MLYFRFDWNESRGDEFDDWGKSTFWFEMGDDGYAVRQLEVYEDGTVLKYDASHMEDKYGGLADQPLEPEENQIPEVKAAEFEAEWAALTARNMRGEDG